MMGVMLPSVGMMVVVCNTISVIMVGTAGVQMHVRPNGMIRRFTNIATTVAVRQSLAEQTHRNQK